MFWVEQPQTKLSADWGPPQCLPLGVLRQYRETWALIGSPLYRCQINARKYFLNVANANPDHTFRGGTCKDVALWRTQLWRCFLCRKIIPVHYANCCYEVFSRK